MKMTVPSRHATGTLDAAPAARIISGVKVYGKGVTAVRALDTISADFAASKFTAIMGPSGSGKSTLLHCLAGLDRLTEGRVLLGDVDLGSLDDKAMTLLRRERIGFVFQAFNLISTLTARENVVLRFPWVVRSPIGPGWKSWRARWGSRTVSGIVPLSSRAVSSSGWRQPGLSSRAPT